MKPSAEKALAYLINNGSITVREAIDHCGTTELRSRISEIRKAGYPVRKVMETGKNKDGEPVSYARYYLEGNKNE